MTQPEIAAAFEAWSAKCFGDTEHDYCEREAFSAGVAAGIAWERDRAAKACEREAKELRATVGALADVAATEASGCDACAAAIRKGDAVSLPEFPR